MLLQELTGVKSLKGKSAGSLLQMLKKENGLTIDHGGFGLVLSHPSWSHVLKFFAKDDGYLKFIDYCMKNSSNKHLPKFLKKPTKLTVFFKNNLGLDIVHWSNQEFQKIDKIYAVKIEKLTPMSDKNLKKICELISSYTFIDKYGVVIGTKKEDEFLKGFDLVPYKDLCQTVFEIYENVPEDSYNDFNDSNFMMRGNVVVVTDPYASKNDDSGMEITKIFSTVELNDLAGDIDVTKQLSR